MKNIEHRNINAIYIKKALSEILEITRSDMICLIIRADNYTMAVTDNLEEIQRFKLAIIITDLQQSFVELNEVKRVLLLDYVSKRIETAWLPIMKKEMVNNPILYIKVKKGFSRYYNLVGGRE
jgi:hypothetical protein